MRHMAHNIGKLLEPHLVAFDLNQYLGEADMEKDFV